VKLSQRQLSRPSLGGLLATRAGALTLALICAVIAAGLLVFALSSYKHTVQTVAQQATVLVATTEIHKGTTGEAIAAENLFKSTPIVSTQVTAGAISNSAVLKGSVAVSDILPGQQLTAAEFTTVAGISGQLGPNQRAVSLPIDEAHGDTDVLQAGDSVDVYAALTDKGTSVLSLLIPDALVIKPAGGAAAAAAPASGAAPAAPVATGASLVLAVSTAQAPALAFASDNGHLWIFLRPADAVNPSPGLTSLSSILSSATATTTGTHP
jgi:Flp pilus assembly protein CpaB